MRDSARAALLALSTLVCLSLGDQCYGGNVLGAVRWEGLLMHSFPVTAPQRGHWKWTGEAFLELNGFVTLTALVDTVSRHHGCQSESPLICTQ